jgi:ATP-binding cassette, subfamily B, bacterial
MMKSKDNSSIFAFKRLFSFIMPYRFWMVVRLCSTVCKAVVDMMVAYFILQLVNSAVLGNKQELMKSIYFMLGFIISGIFIYYLEGYASGRFGANVSRDIKEKLGLHISRLTVPSMENYNSGELVSRLTINVNSIEGFLKGSFLDIVFHVIRFTASFIFMFFINWELLLFCLLIFPFVMILSNIASKSLKKYWKEMNRNHAIVNSIVQDSIGGIHILKAFNLKKVMFEKYKTAVDKTLENSIAIEKRNAMIAPINVVMELVPYVLCFLYGGFLVTKGRLTSGGWVAFAQMLTYLIQGAGSIPGYIAQYRAIMGTAEHLFEILDQKVERSDGKEYNIDEAVPAVEFCQVSFAYNDGTKVIENLDFKVSHGKTVALVGPSGGGKSTVFKLLCGFYELLGGSIKIYGRKLEDWNLSAARSLISLVSQDTYLFPGSIMENIAYGCPGASMDEIIKAAKTANAHDFIVELPEGYHTLAGERGAKLSGGQRQRISLARAILKNAPILLLDEPTAALDIESERQIQGALDTFMEGRTVFIIAHRLTTVKNADDIMVLVKGKVAEMGRHQQLIDKDGIYRKLYFKQVASEIEHQKNKEGKGA